MKSIKIRIYTREELEVKFHLICQDKFGIEQDTLGREMTDVETRVYNRVCEDIRQIGLLLTLDFDKYLLHENRLIAPDSPVGELQYLEPRGKSIWDLQAQYSQINARYPMVVDDDQTRATADHVRRANEIIARYCKRAEEWYQKQFGKTLLMLTYEESHRAMPREVYFGR